MVALPRFLIASRTTPYTGYSGLSGCNISNLPVPLPSSHSAFIPTFMANTDFIGLAFGVQNYTCSSTNNYTSIGAVAELIDMSCVHLNLSGTIQQPAYEAWTNFNASLTDVIDFLPSIIQRDLILGQHYFISNPDGSLSPKWDFTSSVRFFGHPNAYVVGEINATLPDPYNPQVDVPWLQLSKVSGGLATRIFRINTIGGQPPSSCQYGSSSNISVKYAAQYWLSGSTVNIQQPQ